MGSLESNEKAVITFILSGNSSHLQHSISFTPGEVYSGRQSVSFGAVGAVFCSGVQMCLFLTGHKVSHGLSKCLCHLSIILYLLPGSTH